MGEDEPILTDIFQMGWFNHQPVIQWDWIFGGVQTWFKSQVVLGMIFVSAWSLDGSNR